MKDTGQQIKLTVEINANSWHSDRGMIAPGEYHRVITALENMVANMKEEYAEWGLAETPKKP